MVHRDIIVSTPPVSVHPMVFGYEESRPLHKCGPKVRTYWLLHYVTKGRGFFTVGGKTYPVPAGSIFVIPPYTEICYWGDEADCWDYIWIGFHLAGEAPAALQQPVVRCPEAGAVFEKMKTCKGKFLPLSACILELFELLGGGSAELDYVTKALSCIHAEYAQELTVEELAHRLGLDRSYFSDLFKKKTGETPGRYLYHLRMKKAAKLMAEHGYTPSLAAQSCGYPDFPQFSKRFKACFGISPREYRKQHRQDG